MLDQLIVDQSIRELLSDLDECDDALIHEAFLRSLRANGGRRLRAVITMLQASKRTDCQLLARLLKEHPLLCDLVVH